MVKIKITAARKEQVKDYIQLALSTGESFLKNAFKPDTENILTQLYLNQDNSFSHINVKYAQVNGKPVGMMLSYPGSLHLKNQLKTAVKIVKHYIRNKIIPNHNIIKLAFFFGPLKKTDYYICFLAVHPEYQGRKIGSKLLEYARMEAAKTNCNRIMLEVEEKNSLALKFYINKGFENIKSRIIKINGEEYYYRKMSLRV